MTTLCQQAYVRNMDWDSRILRFTTAKNSFKRTVTISLNYAHNSGSNFKVPKFPNSQVPKAIKSPIILVAFYNTCNE